MTTSKLSKHGKIILAFFIFTTITLIPSAVLGADLSASGGTGSDSSRSGSVERRENRRSSSSGSGSSLSAQVGGLGGSSSSAAHSAAGSSSGGGNSISVSLPEGSGGSSFSASSSGGSSNLSGSSSGRDTRRSGSKTSAGARSFTIEVGTGLTGDTAAGSSPGVAITTAVPLTAGSSGEQPAGNEPAAAPASTGGALEPAASGSSGSSSGGNGSGEAVFETGPDPVSGAVDTGSPGPAGGAPASGPAQSETVPHEPGDGTGAGEEAGERETTGAEAGGSAAPGSDQGPGGNSYSAVVEPVNLAEAEEIGQVNTEFRVTFREWSNITTLGSARLTIPDEFGDPAFDPSVPGSITTSTGVEWSGILDGHILSLWASDNVDPFGGRLGENQTVTATFSVTTPGATGIYTFLTEAWTDAADGGGVGSTENTMAAGHDHPQVVIGIQVGTPEDLHDVRTRLDGHYIQVAADIDLSGYSAGEGWEPIGTDAAPFTGSFNGSGYSISNLAVNRPGLDHVGLFGYADGATFRDINLVGVDITGGNRTGSLAGLVRAEADSTALLNCSASGSVTGNGIVGGLVGLLLGLIPQDDQDPVLMTGCSADVAVEGDSLVGGLVGDVQNAAIYDSSAEGNVSGGSHLGGLVGSLLNAVISGSSASGEVNGTGHIVGGLVGFARNSTISGSSATGPVSGVERIGGLVGSAVETLIETSSASGDVSGNLQTGGLAGDISAVELAGSHASGNVTGVNNTGGLVGLSQESDISDSHALGDVTGEYSTGGLVGYTYWSDITGSYAEGSVEGFIYTGGLVGYLASLSTVHGSHATGSVEGLEDTGGLVGSSWISIITESYATGPVVGENYTGGLVGRSEENSRVHESYALGTVTGLTHTGGLVGFNDRSTVANSYAQGSVSGDQYTGGLVGLNGELSTIVNSYSAGAVSAAQGPVGGLVGENAGTVSTSFYDRQTSGQSDTGRGIPISTLQMRTIGTFMDAEWSISGLNGAYPRLWWEFEQDITTTWFMDGPEGYFPGEPGHPDPGLPGPDHPGHDWPEPECTCPGEPGYPGFYTPYPQSWFLPLAAGPIPSTGPAGIPVMQVRPVQVDHYLVLRPFGFYGQATVNSAFVGKGNHYDLVEAKAVYNTVLRHYNENRNTMSESALAVATVDLTVALAAIRVVEARLSGSSAALEAALRAYREAQAALQKYGHLLTEVQLMLVGQVMKAIEAQLRMLGAPL